MDSLTELFCLIDDFINSQGEWGCIKLTPGNTDDRHPLPERHPTDHQTQEKHEARAPHRLREGILRRRSLVETVIAQR